MNTFFKNYSIWVLVILKSMKRILKQSSNAFQIFQSLFLGRIEFICDCNQWSTLCLHCSYQCFDVLTKLFSLKKLIIWNSCNFRISCESLEKFNKLCRIIVYFRNFDFEGLVENVKQFCSKKPQRMFYLQLKHNSSEKITELSQNIPKNLSIKPDPLWKLFLIKKL